MSTIAKHMTGAIKKSKPVDHATDQKHRDKGGAAADRQTSAKPSSIKVVRIRVEDVRVPKKWRSINKEKLESIAKSMKGIGHRNPISVRAIKNGFRLITGRHRLEAAKKLEWKRINAIVMRGDKLDQRIWHDAENLERGDLTALERAESEARMAKNLAKRAARDAHPGGHQPHDKGVTKAAKVIGVSRDNIRRSKTIAAISSVAKEAARDVGLADNGAALLKVAKEPTPEAQVRKVRELATPKGASKPELSKKERKQFNGLKRTFAEATDHRRAWKRAGKSARDRFIAHIRKLAPSE